MEQTLRDEICRIVRSVVVEAYGEPTCAATVKVLSEVLRACWGIDLSAHVVSLKIVPPKVIEIMESTELTEKQKLALIEQLPPGESAKALESTEDEMKFHLVGLSGTGKEYIFWDPSIDQINKELDSCHFNPMTLSMSSSKSDATGNIVFKHQGCHLIYREQKELEGAVFSSEVWLTDYSELIEKAVKLCSNTALQPTSGRDAAFLG